MWRKTLVPWLYSVFVSGVLELSPKMPFSLIRGCWVFIVVLIRHRCGHPNSRKSSEQSWQQTPLKREGGVWPPGWGGHRCNCFGQGTNPNMYMRGNESSLSCQLLNWDIFDGCVKGGQIWEEPYCSVLNAVPTWSCPKFGRTMWSYNFKWMVQQDWFITRTCWVLWGVCRFSWCLRRFSIFYIST